MSARRDTIVPMDGAVTQREIAREAKELVAQAFRNGPIEQIHAGRTCPTCAGNEAYSRLSDDEMKSIMKNAVNHVYKLSSTHSIRNAATANAPIPQNP